MTERGDAFAGAPRHFVGPWARPLRSLLQWILLWPVLSWFCHPLRKRGRVRRSGGILFVANHSSHADTAVILRALPWKARRRTCPAAAQDHFWRRPLVGAFVSLLTGAFPFPRRGCVGLERARDLLRAGCNVLLFPEGTRGSDASVGEFHRGAALLAHEGFTVVPIGIAGTGEILAKGRVRPGSAPVAVVFGDAIPSGCDIDVTTTHFREGVECLALEAEALRHEASATTFERWRSFARSRWTFLAIFAWAVAEALVWPLIPDFLLLPLALGAPAAFLSIAVVATLGSVTGGALAYLVGGSSWGSGALTLAPLVTDRMVEAAQQLLSERGSGALAEQPLSGIPYKTFAYQAGVLRTDFGGFLATTALARGARFLGVAAVAAGAGVLARPVWERYMGPFLALYVLGFGLGLGLVLSSWR